MKKLKVLISKMQIKYKLVLSMYLAMFPIMLVISLYMYVKSYNSTVSDMINIYGNLVQTVDKTIIYLQADLLDLSTYLCVNSDVQQILNADINTFQSDLTLIWEKSAPKGFIKDMISIKSHIKTLILYAENGMYPLYISSDKSVHNTDITQMHQTNFYQEALLAKGDSVWTKMSKGKNDLFTDNKSDKIVVSKVLFDLTKKQLLGYLVIGINENEFKQPCRNALQQENEGIAVLSKNGYELVRVGNIDENVLTYIGQEDFLKKSPEDKNVYFEYDNYFVFCRQSSLNSNIVCYMVPKANWLIRTQRTKELPIAFSIAFLAAFLPLSMFASSTISKPLQKLYRSMIKFKDGDFEQQVEIDGYDEIGVVAGCYNQMVKDIKELINKNYVIVLQEKESELNALQAQINPHFLYNTLDSLYWHALKIGSDRLAEDIFSLSQLFRITLSHGRGEIPISREKELIFHYLQIQKMRFEKKLNYKIDMDEEILDLKIPKLILQPFVENAIVHGLECTGEMGLIEITGRLDKDYVLFQIKDNGVGISKEQLIEIFDEEEKGEYASQRISHYAIRNVRERLSLIYHDDFKLNIESEIGQGTTVIIVIPARNS